MDQDGDGGRNEECFANNGPAGRGRGRGRAAGMSSRQNLKRKSVSSTEAFRGNDIDAANSTASAFLGGMGRYNRTFRSWMAPNADWQRLHRDAHAPVPDSGNFQHAPVPAALPSAPRPQAPVSQQAAAATSSNFPVQRRRTIPGYYEVRVPSEPNVPGLYNTSPISITPPVSNNAPSFPATGLTMSPQSTALPSPGHATLNPKAALALHNYYAQPPNQRTWNTQPLPPPPPASRTQRPEAAENVSYMQQATTSHNLCSQIIRNVQDRQQHHQIGVATAATTTQQNQIPYHDYGVPIQSHQSPPGLALASMITNGRALPQQVIPMQPNQAVRQESDQMPPALTVALNVPIGQAWSHRAHQIPSNLTFTTNVATGQSIPQNHHRRSSSSSNHVQTPTRLVSFRNEPTVSLQRSSRPQFCSIMTETGQMVYGHKLILDSHLYPSALIPPRYTEDGQKLYVAMKDCAIPPTILGLERVKSWKFAIDEETFKLLSMSKPIASAPGKPHSMRFIRQGSLMYRLRFTSLQDHGKLPDSDAWTKLETTLPVCVFAEINGNPLDFRRKARWNRDYPADLTDFVICGENEVKIVSFDRDQLKTQVAFAVEILEANSRDKIVQECYTIPTEEARNKVLARIGSVTSEIIPIDDEISITESKTVIISVICPVSQKLINRPVRGKDCTHLACFDLDSFLISRPTGLSGVAVTDAWVCPECGTQTDNRTDCRPQSLVMDKYILEIINKIKQYHQSDEIKAISVRADGKWKVHIPALLKSTRQPEIIEID